MVIPVNTFMVSLRRHFEKTCSKSAHAEAVRKKNSGGLENCTVTVSDGIIINLYGLVEGRQPDAVMYRRSEMEQFLQESFVIDRVQYCIYSNAAYMLRAWLIKAYPRHTATAVQESFNEAMNVVRTTIEGRYKKSKSHLRHKTYLVT
eukprot:IDg4212t1